MIPEYYKHYLALVEDKPITVLIREETKKALEFYANINKKDALFRYENNKWSIQELLGHVTDTDQIFTFRLLCLLRGEKQSLPGFDENDYVKKAQFDLEDWELIQKRFNLGREQLMLLVSGISDDEFDLTINANGIILSAEVICKVIIGHEMHHRQFVADNYLPKIEYSSRAK